MRHDETAISSAGQEEMGPTKDGRPERRERKKRKSSKQEDGTDPATVAETPSRKLKRVRKPAKRSGGTDSAERNGSGRNGTGETEPDGKTLHQLVAERQKRSKEGRFSAGMRSAGMGSDGMRPEEAAWVLAGAAEQRNKGGGRGRKRIALGVLQDGARAQGTVHTGDGEQEAIEALVYSLRARAHKRGRRHVLDPDDREGLDSENAGQGDEMAGEVGGGKEVKEAKERCMWAIMDLLGKSPRAALNEVPSVRFLWIRERFSKLLRRVWKAEKRLRRTPVSQRHLAETGDLIGRAGCVIGTGHSLPILPWRSPRAECAVNKLRDASPRSYDESAVFDGFCYQPIHKESLSKCVKRRPKARERTLVDYTARLLPTLSFEPSSCLSFSSKNKT